MLRNDQSHGLYDSAAIFSQNFTCRMNGLKIKFLLIEFLLNYILSEID